MDPLLRLDEYIEPCRTRVSDPPNAPSSRVGQECPTYRMHRRAASDKSVRPTECPVEPCRIRVSDLPNRDQSSRDFRSLCAASTSAPAAPPIISFVTGSGTGGG